MAAYEFKCDVDDLRKLEISLEAPNRPAAILLITKSSTDMPSQRFFAVIKKLLAQPSGIFFAEEIRAYLRQVRGSWNERLTRFHFWE